jgi:hypothetical protein
MFAHLVFPQHLAQPLWNFGLTTPLRLPCPFEFARIGFPLTALTMSCSGRDDKTERYEHPNQAKPRFEWATRPELGIQSERLGQPPVGKDSSNAKREERRDHETCSATLTDRILGESVLTVVALT